MSLVHDDAHGGVQREEQVSDLRREMDSLRSELKRELESVRSELKFQGAIRFRTCSNPGDNMTLKSFQSLVSVQYGTHEDGEVGGVVSDQAHILRMRVDSIEAACKDLQRTQTEAQDASSAVVATQQVMQTEWTAEARAIKDSNTALVDHARNVEEQLSEVRTSIAEVREKQTEIVRHIEEHAIRAIAFTKQLEELRQAVADRDEQQNRLDGLDRLVAETRQDNRTEFVVLRGRVENATGDLHQHQASLNELKSEFELEQKRRETCMAMLTSRIEDSEQMVRQEANVSFSSKRNANLVERLEVAESDIRTLYANAQDDQIETRLEIVEQKLAAVPHCDPERNSDVAAMSADALAQHDLLVKRVDLIAKSLDTVQARGDLLTQQELSIQICRLSGEMSGRLGLLEENMATLWESDKAKREASETDSTQVLSSSVASFSMSENDSVGSAAIEKVSNEVKELRAALTETCTGLERLALDLAQFREDHTSTISNVGDLIDFVAITAASSIKDAEARIDRQTMRSVAELESIGAAQRQEMSTHIRSMMSAADTVRGEASCNTDLPRQVPAAFEAGYIFAEKMEQFRAELTAHIDATSALLWEELESKVKATETRMGVFEQSLIDRLDDAVPRCTSRPRLEQRDPRRLISTSATETATPRSSTSEGFLMNQEAALSQGPSRTTSPCRTRESDVPIPREGRVAPNIEERNSDVRQGSLACSEIRTGRFKSNEIRLRSVSPVNHSKLHEDMPLSSKISSMHDTSMDSVHISSASSCQSSRAAGSSYAICQRSSTVCGQGRKTSLGPQAQLRSSEGGDFTSSTRGEPPRDSLGNNHATPVFGTRIVSSHADEGRDSLLKPRIGVPFRDTHAEARFRLERHSTQRSTSARSRVKR